MLWYGCCGCGWGGVGGGVCGGGVCRGGVGRDSCHVCFCSGLAVACGGSGDGGVVIIEVRVRIGDRCGDGAVE